MSTKGDRGLCCDIPSHVYSFSFELNRLWTRGFAPGLEIRWTFDFRRRTRRFDPDKYVLERRTERVAAP